MTRRRARLEAVLLTISALGSATRALAEDVTIEGHVTDRSGAPITSATLSAWECRDLLLDDPPGSDFTTVTRSAVDERGRYRLVVPVKYDQGLALVVRSSGFRPGVVWFSRQDLARGRLEVHPLALRPEQPSAPPTHGATESVQARTVRLRVVDLGRPVQGARVRAVGASGGRVVTDQAGSCVLSLASDGGAAIEVDVGHAIEVDEGQRGWARVHATYPLSDAAEQELELRRDGGWISGATNQWELQVPSGTIISGRQVTFESADGRYRATMSTVEGGRFRLPTTAAGTLLVDPLAGDRMCGNDYRPTVAPVVRVPVKAGLADLRVMLHDGVVLGRVVGGTGFGVAHAVVMARLSTGESLRVESGERGTFAFWNLPAGVTRIEVTEPFGEGSADVDVIEGRQHELTVRLR
ncbi:MAG: hypothetical protein KF878_05835 [Planctomycetes bacterium]|nr:hypothetical protein [Planctomycetota bacterium]